MNFDINQQQAGTINNVNGAQIHYHDHLIIIDPVEMANLIDSFYSHVDGFCEAIQDTSSLKRTKIEKKNELNGMSNYYYETSIKEYFISFMQVKEFLGDPINIKHKRRYNYIRREINSKLAAYKERFPNFDQAIEHLTSNYIERINGDFEKKELVRTFIAYMYFMCEIGKTIDEEGEV
ncbi:ABC-three component system protein [Priestia sp. JSM ZJ58]|uniref:ABC-three component system protein n=1 Tax=Priestia sp. JSM ZJ58 TaxID=3376189 RepID=UPI0037AB0A76